MLKKFGKIHYENRKFDWQLTIYSLQMIHIARNSKKWSKTSILKQSVSTKITEKYFRQQVHNLVENLLVTMMEKVQIRNLVWNRVTNKLFEP